MFEKQENHSLCVNLIAKLVVSSPSVLRGSHIWLLEGGCHSLLFETHHLKTFWVGHGRQQKIETSKEQLVSFGASDQWMKRRIWSINFQK